MKKLAYQTLNFVAALTLALGGYSEVNALSISETRPTRLQGYTTSSNIYYVSPAGSDTNSGSATAPFKTFAKAVSILAAGDTLQVLSGTYTETLTLSKSGTDTAPITIIGNGAVLNMKGIQQNGITITGSYVNVSHFEITGAVDFGILITGKHDTVQSNSLHDNVTKNGVGTCGTSTSWSSALKVQMGGDNSVIRGNTVYNNCGEGIAVTRGITSLLESNVTYDNFSVNIYIDNSPYITVRSNTSYCLGTHLRNGNRPNGVALGEESYSGWGAQLHDVTISGNTIKDCGTGIAAFQSDVGGTLTNVTLSNNNIPSGQKRSISIQTLSNKNVLIANNTLFNSIYVYQPQGVTLTGNLIGTVAPTATASPMTTSPTATKTVSTATSAPVIASPTSTLSSASTSQGTIYDDKDSRFVYSSGWKNATTQSAYGGSYMLTTLNSASATLIFTGQSLSVLYRGGTTYRKMNVYIDNVFVGTINEHNSTGAFQLRWDYSGQLTTGTHTLKLVFVTTNTSGSTHGSIDAVIVR